MNPSDEPFDALLREAFDGSVADDGFAYRVMAGLPPRKHRRVAWPLMVGTCVGGLACFLSIQRLPLWREAWHDGLAGHLSGATLAVMGCMLTMAVLAMAWSLVEVQDR